MTHTEFTLTLAGIWVLFAAAVTAGIVREARRDAAGYAELARVFAEVDRWVAAGHPVPSDRPDGKGAR